MEHFLLKSMAIVVQHHCPHLFVSILCALSLYLFSLWVLILFSIDELPFFWGHEVEYILEYIHAGMTVTFTYVGKIYLPSV